MENVKNLDQLPNPVQKVFYPFLEGILDLHQKNIRSVIIYGSATGQNYSSRTSDINSAVIFKELRFDTFQKTLTLVRRYRRKRVSAPLFLTHEYILSSLDVFPIEFLEMKENHILLYGEDLLNSLNIQGEHIRLFCEQQIKGKLIRIRQAYLDVGQHPRGMEALLKEALGTLIPVFRNLLRLTSRALPQDKEQVLKDVCVCFGLDAEVFLTIYRDKHNDDRIGNQAVEVYLERFIEQLGNLSNKIDRLGQV